MITHVGLIGAPPVLHAPSVHHTTAVGAVELLLRSCKGRNQKEEHGSEKGEERSRQEIGEVDGKPQKKRESSFA